MASQNPDLEKGVSDIQPVPARFEAQTVQAPVPAITQASESRPLSINQQPYVPASHRAQFVSTNSAMTLNHFDALQKFRGHLGIHNDDALTTNRVAANLGIFPRIVASEKQAHRQFETFSWLINAALGLQIIFAAALTALGAGNGPRSAVTAFGALNTIIAGFLAFLKGSGLPNRLKYYENEWTKLREYIEQRERDFAHVTMLDHDLNLLEEIAVIERMYETTRRDIEANTPDSYISLTRHSGSGNPPAPSLSRNLSLYSQKAEDRLSQVQDSARDRYSYLQNGIDSRLRDTQSMASGALQELRNTADARVRQTREVVDDEKAKHQAQVSVSVREAQADAEAQIRSIQEAAEARIREMQNTIKQGEDKTKEVESKALSTTEKAAEKVLNFIHHRRDGH